MISRGYMEIEPNTAHVNEELVRYAVEIADFTERLAGSGFRGFSETVASGGKVRGLAAPGGAARNARTSDTMFPRRCRPAPVMIDSGWNCTP